MRSADAQIRALRGPKEPGTEPPRLEMETFPDGSARAIATVFLRNGECPLACVYCALYRHTTARPATGAEIAAQIRAARGMFPEAAGLKLYNASSLFEPLSIDQNPGSLREIAAALSGLDLVVVEARSENAHRAGSFRRLLAGRLEVAIGLESSDDELLFQLNKPTSVERFRAAAATLAADEIFLRAFVLAGPPFVPEGEVRYAAVKTFGEASRAGARVVSLLPVVSRHEPMEALRRAGFFSEISLDEYFETVCDCAGDLPAGAGRRPVVLAETEFLSQLPGCANCGPEKTRRLAGLNSTGQIARFACNDHRPVPPVAVRRPRPGEIAAALARRAPA
ncbi:MAG: hypothetical protein ACRD16_10325 [Thermoanaerobaculia bacterium]